MVPHSVLPDADPLKHRMAVLKGTLTRDFLHAVVGIKTCPATPLFIP